MAGATWPLPSTPDNCRQPQPFTPQGPHTLIPPSACPGLRVFILSICHSFPWGVRSYQLLFPYHTGAWVPRAWPSPLPLHSRGQMCTIQSPSDCPGKQVQFPHCSRLVLNCSGHVLDLRRPYLILSSLTWNRGGFRGSLPRHSLPFQLQTYLLWKQWANMLKYLLTLRRA